jgi:alpha-L-fucosidase 2
LPRAWPAGSIRGIRVRGAAELDLRWAGGRLADCAIRPRLSGVRTIRCGRNRRTVSLRAGRTIHLTGPDLELHNA